MLTNLRGNVELDPMRVPTPAAMTTGLEDSFESVLQEAVADDVEAEPAAEPTEPAPEAALPEEPVVDPDADRAAADQQDQPAPFDTPEEPAAAFAEQTAGPTAAAETYRRGEPVRQETAGKGADSPRTSSRDPESLLAAFVVHAATPAAPTTGAIAGGQSGVQGVTSAKAANAATRGFDGTLQASATPTRAAAVAAGYRTASTTAQAQLLDQARDSVFQQILLKLTPEGGEMRMRLDPPELGELDLHMVVEGGNKLSLSIAAERQDMTQLIQRHLDELKQTLQASGLEVTDAQVHTRGDRAGDQRHFGPRQPHSGGDHQDATASTPLPKRGGYVSAEGLDFWV